MKIIKMIIVYAMIILPTFGWSFLGGAGKEAAELASKAGIEMTTIASGAAPTFGSDGAASLADAMKFASVAGVVATKVASAAVIQTALIIAGSAFACYGVYKAIDYGARLYTYNYPDQEKQAMLKDAEEKITVVNAKQAFRNCLTQHAKDPRNSEGFPINCQECGRAFAMAAGDNAYQEMVKTFKTVY